MHLGSDEVTHAELIAWFASHNTDHELNKSFHVAMGPEQSFFASSMQSFRWSGTIESFHRSLQYMLGPTGWKRTPAHVSFGINKCYVIVWNDGYISFNRDIGTFYPKLYSLIDKINEKPTGTISVRVTTCIRGRILFVED